MRNKFSDSQCDHYSVYMEIEKKAWQPKGPGFWKFDSSLLESYGRKRLKILKTKGSSGKTKVKKCRDQGKFLTTEPESLQNLKDSQLGPEHIKEWHDHWIETRKNSRIFLDFFLRWSLTSKAHSWAEVLRDMARFGIVTFLFIDENVIPCSLIFIPSCLTKRQCCARRCYLGMPFKEILLLVVLTHCFYMKYVAFEEWF